MERSRGVFFAQWDELLQLRRAVLKTSDPEDIHDLRVASRRFRAALELFGPVVPNAAQTELLKSIRSITRSLGGLRNIDEALLFFLPRARTDRSAATKLSGALSSLRPGELKRIKKGLIAFDQSTLDRMVRGIVAGMNENSIAAQSSISLLAYFSDASIRLFLPIHQLLAVSTAPERRTSRHALRIAIKKWRYFFEIVAPILERDYSRPLLLLKEYQSFLGKMNDVAEFEVLLSKLKLPPDERECAKATLLSEDTLLLEGFKKLIEQKPLTYTFLI
jgi:CHAD domain-containing protein